MICTKCSAKTPTCVPTLFQGKYTCTKFVEKIQPEGVMIYSCADCSKSTVRLSHVYCETAKKQFLSLDVIPDWCPLRK